MASARPVRPKESVAEPTVDEAGATAYAPTIQVLDQTSRRLALVQMHLPASPSLSWLGLAGGASQPILLLKMTAT
jgi:hypothetical protein